MPVASRSERWPTIRARSSPTRPPRRVTPSPRLRSPPVAGSRWVAVGAGAVTTVAERRPDGWSEVTDVICCSLEPWDEVWRRNQHLATELLGLRPTMRLLFAEAPVDVPWSLVQRRWPGHVGLRSVGDSGRLWAMAPRKWVPRRVWAGGDRSLFRQVTAASRQAGVRTTRAVDQRQRVRPHGHRHRLAQRLRHHRRLGVGNGTRP